MYRALLIKLNYGAYQADRGTSDFFERRAERIFQICKLAVFFKRRDLTGLLKELKRFHPEFKKKSFTKENIFSALYPGKIYNDTVMRNLFSNLLRMAEGYLAYKNLHKSKFDVSRHLLAELIERKAVKTAISKIKEAEAILSDKNAASENYYRKSFDLENFKMMMNVQQNKQHMIKDSIYRQAELSIYSMFEDASISVINMLNNSENFNMDFEDNFFNLFLKHLDLREFLNSVQKVKAKHENPEKLEIYTSTILTIVNPHDENNFFTLKHLIAKNLESMSRLDKYSRLVLLGSCASTMAKTVNREKYLPELFEVYKTRYEKKLYSFSDTQDMSIIFFVSSFKTAVMAKETGWAEAFTDKAVHLIAPAHRGNITNYAYAHLYFFKGDYETALSYAGKTEFELFSLKYDMRNLTLQIYYELGELEHALYLLDTYRHFLLTNRTVSEYFREPNMAFINLYSRLVKIRMNKDGAELGLLKKAVKESALYQSEWLEKKAEEL